MSGSLSRRQLFFASGSAALTLGFEPLRAGAQEKEKQPAAPALAPLNRFPRTVQEWYVEQVRAAEKRGEEARAKLKTKADAEAYVRDVRANVKQANLPATVADIRSDMNAAGGAVRALAPRLEDNLERTGQFAQP